LTPLTNQINRGMMDMLSQLPVLGIIVTPVNA